MGILSAEIKLFVDTQKLGFVATVCPDGSPNLSPKGTTRVWDDAHLMFADIHSPGTIGNLLTNPSVEINMVDVFTRKGYRFKGNATVLSSGPVFEKAVTLYDDAREKYTINHIVLIKINVILPLVSPVYDTGASEEEVINRWTGYWHSVHPDK